MSMSMKDYARAALLHATIAQVHLSFNALNVKVEHSHFQMVALRLVLKERH
jgi:hypothetical protein